MIGILENMVHQMTVTGTGLIAEAKTGNVDVTGYQVFDEPEIEINPDGSITMRIAVSVTKKARKSSKGTAEIVEIDGSDA